MKFLDYFFEFRKKVLAYFLIIIVSAMVVAVFWQVLTRIAFKAPAVWTEETSTYLLMWCGVIGAAYAYGEKAHVGMEYFAQKLNKKNGLILELIITLLIAYFSFQIFILGGINFVQNAFINGQTSPTMNIPTGYLYLCLPISGFFILTFCLEFFIEDLNSLLALKGNSR
jgi:TRAP-type C4-dicarboxylate transport system permease small subunit